MPAHGASPGTSVAARALALLGAFDAEHRALRLTGLARRADLSMATAYRLVGELAGFGAVERTTGGRYVVGARMWRIGTLAAGPGALREIAAPFLQDVYAATLATVHLAVRDGVDALYLARVSGHRSVPILSTEGTRTPLHATAVGKVLLAYAPAAVRDEMLAGLTRVTAYTIVHPARLTKQLDRVLSDGFAESNEEMSLGASAVAVPVLSGAPEPIAALGATVGPARGDRSRLVAALTMAARGIARGLTDAGRFGPAQNFIE